jgi:hypothetical protein
VTVTDANGTVVESATSDAAGAFATRRLAPGTYSVLIEMNLFSAATQAITVPTGGAIDDLRIVLEAGGFAETVVVTARGAESRLALKALPVASKSTRFVRLPPTRPLRRISRRAGDHALALTAFHATESGHTTNVTSTNPLDVPYLSFESELAWTGTQVRDGWNWSRRNGLVAGIDYDTVSS